MTIGNTEERIIKSALEIATMASEPGYDLMKLREAVIDLAEWAGMTATADVMDHQIVILTDCQYHYNDIVEYEPVA